MCREILYFRNAEASGRDSQQNLCSVNAFMQKGFYYHWRRKRREKKERNEENCMQGRKKQLRASSRFAQVNNIEKYVLDLLSP